MRKVSKKVIALETMEDLKGLALGTKVKEDALNYYIVEEGGLHSYYEDCFEKIDAGLESWEALEENADYIDGWLYIGEFEGEEDAFYDPYGEYDY